MKNSTKLGSLLAIAVFAVGTMVSCKDKTETETTETIETTDTYSTDSDGTMTDPNTMPADTTNMGTETTDAPAP